MNNPAINRDESKASKFDHDLQVVNDDWPLLGELSQNKFVLKNKKPHLNVAKIAKEIVEQSFSEEGKISENTIRDEKLFEESFPNEVQEFNANKGAIHSVVNDEPFIQVETLKSVSTEAKPVVQSTVVSTPVVTVSPIAQVKSISPNVASLQSENQSNNPLLKLIAIGLTKLYVRKTTTVLNPVKFVADNYKNIFIALLHLGVPILMSWFLLTQVEFIKVQLVNVSTPMFWTYAVIFYFASLFVWVTSQVIIAGLGSMFKTALVSVANGVEAKDKD